MMITMLIVFTIGGQNFERHEPMPNLATCWERAPERMNALLAAHPEMAKLLSAVSSTMATRSDLSKRPFSDHHRGDRGRDPQGIEEGRHRDPQDRGDARRRNR